MGQVEFDEVVAQQELRASGKVVQLGKCTSEAGSRYRKCQGLSGVRAYSCESADATVFDADFKVQ